MPGAIALADRYLDGANVECLADPSVAAMAPAACATTQCFAAAISR